jgi:hypothetical protein
LADVKGCINFFLVDPIAAVQAFQIITANAGTQHRRRMAIGPT